MKINKNKSRTNNSFANSTKTTLARTFERHRLTNGLYKTFQTSLSTTAIFDQTKEEKCRQLEADGKKNEARVYASLFYLK